MKGPPHDQPIPFISSQDAQEVQNCNVIASAIPYTCCFMVCVDPHDGMSAAMQVSITLIATGFGSNGLAGSSVAAYTERQPSDSSSQQQSSDR